MSFEVPLSWISWERLKRPEEELEKIDVAIFKLKEKYGEYRDMKLFIDYMGGIERIFVLAKVRKWKADEIRKAFVEAQAHLMSLDSSIDEDIFNNIKDDFQSAYQLMDMIRTIAAKLIEEHSACKSCVAFIEYMRDSLILLSDISKVNIDENKDKILRSRMFMIGEPHLGELEKIYGEFKILLKEK
mgnify:CR=1 FL=1